MQGEVADNQSAVDFAEIVLLGAFVDQERVAHRDVVCDEESQLVGDFYAIFEPRVNHFRPHEKASDKQSADDLDVDLARGVINHEQT